MAGGHRAPLVDHRHAIVVLDNGVDRPPQLNRIAQLLGQALADAMAPTDDPHLLRPAARGHHGVDPAAGPDVEEEVQERHLARLGREEAGAQEPIEGERHLVIAVGRQP